MTARRTGVQKRQRPFLVGVRLNAEERERLLDEAAALGISPGALIRLRVLGVDT